MFGFDRDEAEELGAAGRYQERIKKFEKKQRRFPRLQHALWWVLHNAVAHPFLLMPCKWSFQFHDWSSRKLNAE
jgi:hypothetical protein